MLIDPGPTPDVVTLAPGELLCRSGEQLEAVYQLQSGELAVMSGEMQVATLTAPALVGEISAVAGGLTTADVRAIDTCQVAKIPIPTFHRWLAEHPEEASSISATARERADNTRAQIILTDLVGHDSPDVVTEIADRLTWRDLQADELLFAQGDDSDAAYIVVTGRVRVRRVDSDGVITLDSEVSRGALVGELGLIEDQPRSTSIRAIRDTTLARLSKQDFDEVTALNPAITIRIVRSILDRIQRGDQRSNRNRLFAIAVTDPGETGEFVASFVDEAREFGPSEFLNAELADAVLGRPGMTEAPVESAGYRRLADLLHESEAENDYLIVATDRTTERWTDRAVQRCDRLLIVTSDRPSADEAAEIESLLARIRPGTNKSVWIVRRYPPGRQPHGAARLLCDERIDDVLHVEIGNESDVRRMARLASGNGTGVVLGGGGGRGFAHLGAVEALDELGVPIDAVAGASIGAVVASVLAQRVDPSKRVGVVAAAFKDLLDYTVPIVALLRSEKITANIERQLGGWQIENTWVPFTCVSTNLTTARIEVHSSGSLSQAVRATVAIPGVLPPVTHNGDLLVDGGVLDNLPIDGFVADDWIGTIVVIDLEPPDQAPTRREFSPDVSGVRALWARLHPKEENYPTIASTIIRSLLVAATRQREVVLASGDVDLYLLLRIDDIGLLDFDKVPEVAALGYTAALPQIQSWLTSRHL